MQEAPAGWAGLPAFVFVLVKNGFLSAYQQGIQASPSTIPSTWAV